MRKNKIHLKVKPTPLFPLDYLAMEIPSVPTALDFAARKGYTVLLVEDVDKYPINIMSGYFQCCGVMCPKDELQGRIDMMQSAIDRANYYLSGKESPEGFLEHLKQDLAELTSR